MRDEGAADGQNVTDFARRNHDPPAVRYSWFMPAPSSSPTPSPGQPAVTTRRPASIQDVAAAAGVSTATVSRVLNSPGLVSAQTAERVNRVILELGYRPNPYAQGLTTRRKQVLGIALPDIHGEFYSELLRGADEESRRLGYHLLVTSEPRAAAGAEGDTALPFGLVAGIALMMTEPNERMFAEAQRSGVPLVVLDAEVDEPGVDSIVVDNAEGTREAVAHLLRSTPPERCWFVGGPRENFDTQKRAAVFGGMVGAAAAGNTAFGSYDVEWGRSWAASMVAAGRLRGAAVLAGNDEIALGIMQASQEAGLTLPADLRVVGFDDTRLATLVRPRLSTVHVPMAQVGEAAIRALAARIDDPSAPTMRVRLPTRLVVRETSGAADGDAGGGG